MTPWRPMSGHLTAPGLELGPWHDDDLDAYDRLVHERDPRTRAAPRDGRPSREDMIDTIRRQQDSIAETGIGLLVVRVDGQFAGYCGLVAGHATLDEPEIAYELSVRHHGAGLATAAARAVVDEAAATGRHRLWATVRPWNTRSFRVLDKLGFHRTDRVDVDDFGASIWCTRALDVEPGSATAHPS